MKFVYKVWSNYDGFTPAEFPPASCLATSWSSAGTGTSSPSRGTRRSGCISSAARWPSPACTPRASLTPSTSPAAGCSSGSAKHRQSATHRHGDQRTYREASLPEDYRSSSCPMHSTSHRTATSTRALTCAPETAVAAPHGGRCRSSSSATWAGRCGSPRPWLIRSRLLGHPASQLHLHAQRALPARHLSDERALSPLQDGREEPRIPARARHPRGAGRPQPRQRRAVVPVPLSPDKAAAGEINRTLLLAKELGRQLGTLA